MSETARCQTVIKYDFSKIHFNDLVVQAAVENKWKIVDALFQRDIQFNESALQTLLLEAFRQRRKHILYGIMYSPFINLEKCILQGIENSYEDFVNYILRHYDEFDENVINQTFKSVVKSHRLRTVKLLLSQNTSYLVDMPTILEAREMLIAPDNFGENGHTQNMSTHPISVGKKGQLKNMSSLLNQRLDVIAYELAQQVTDLNGHVQIPEICLKPFHGAACPRFHSLLDFHWQISLGGSYWLNLPQDIMYCLENYYCDPSSDGIVLSRLDPLKPLHADLLCILGREVWRADFTHSCMQLKGINSSKSIYLRRLHKNIPFIWYYQDDSGIWEEYKDNLTSESIEKYKLHNLNEIKFKRSNFFYEICLISMTQKNNTTGKIRNIIRRPKRSCDNSNFEDSELQELPSFWDDMKPLEVVKIVNIPVQSWEYKSVFNRIFFDQNLKIKQGVSIERIQNPYLWRSFQNKLQEMKKQRLEPVKVLKLIHCTSSSYSDIISHDNIDYRLYLNRNSYGAHFSQTINHAEMNSRSLNFISPVFILAHVAVGTVTNYDPKMIRPISTAMNLPPDTAVDNIEKPNLYVKYESQEYYPEYIIKLN